ncbi:MAG: serine/threonine-protein kinase [bacterium]
MTKEIKFVGNYKILDIIGRGGMSKVYTAIQMPLNRIVVVKEMSKSSSSEYRKRFKNEALITAGLEHPNIVAIYDYFSVGQASYLVMQYVDGVSLADVIENETPLHPVVAGLIAREICLAISHAHRNNIIHRDIKPTNVLISKEGHVKITDFGVAKDATARDLTSAGTLIGTPCYMSPEQAMGKRLSAQSDVFSTGIVLYEMLTGKKPFWGESAEDITARIARGKYKSPFFIDPHHSYRLARIINKALKKNLNRRYETVARMASDLENFVGWKNLASGEQTLSQIVSSIDLKKQTTTVIRKKKKKKKKKRSTNIFFLYFLLIVVVATFILVLFRVLFRQ